MSEEIKKTSDAEAMDVKEETTEVVENTEETINNEVVDVEIEKEAEEQAAKVNDVVADIKIDEKSKKNIKTTDIEAGMYLKVYQRITEKGPKGEDKSRLQMFEGICLARKHGNQNGATFTVRKVTKTGHIVEKIYPIYLPTLEKVELYKTFRTVKSKLYFIRKPGARKLKVVK